MSLIVSAYDGDENANENRLLFWLRLDNWSLVEAATVIADVDPDTAQLHKGNFFGFKTFQNDDYSSADNYCDHVPFWDSELAIYQRKYEDIRRILFRPDVEYDTPAAWIGRAIAKKVKIPWFKFAIRQKIIAFDYDINGNKFLKFINGIDEFENKDLYVNQTDVASIAKMAESNYLTGLLKIQNLTINEFFNPRKSVDAKQDEVVEWIKAEGKKLNIDVSDNVAASMFTIIKPIDHNPKKKRV